MNEKAEIICLLNEFHTQTQQISIYARHRRVRAHTRTITTLIIHLGKRATYENLQNGILYVARV